MSVEHTVWSLDDKKPLKGAELKDEKELELLILDNIEILNKGWLVLGNQVRTNSGKYIDILCMDHDGDMVIVELKKDLTPREVTAQVLDYAASVSAMTTDDIAQIFLSNHDDKASLNEVYREKYGKELDEESVNTSVKMVIVAAQMDNETERIIKFLRDVYQVDINIMFFHVFKTGDQRLISRAWFQEDDETAYSPRSKRKEWNQEYYVSYGLYEDGRTWEDAKEYGFISAGHGEWYTKTLGLLSPGDRVWVNIPHTGYVGVGTVLESVQQAKDVVFEVNGKRIRMEELPLEGEYFHHKDDPELAEYIVKVKWDKTVPISEAVSEIGFFGNQNTVCRPTSSKWTFTVEQLKKQWEID